MLLLQVGPVLQLCERHAIAHAVMDGLQNGNDPDQPGGWAAGREERMRGSRSTALAQCKGASLLPQHSGQSLPFFCSFKPRPPTPLPSPALAPHRPLVPRLAAAEPPRIQIESFLAAALEAVAVSQNHLLDSVYASGGMQQLLIRLHAQVRRNSQPNCHTVTLFAGNYI